MTGKCLAFIARASRFSPGSEAHDCAILDAVRQRLSVAGVDCLEPVSEEQLSELPEADGYVSMARSEAILALLDIKQEAGLPVFNSPQSVMLCNRRSQLMQQIEEAGIAVPPHHSTRGYWVKRGTGCRECPDDVQYAPDLLTAEKIAEGMRQRGIEEIDLRAHVEGQWVKFYGVRGTDFLRCFPVPPSSSLVPPSSFLLPRVHDLAQKAVSIVPGLDIYGGDCIVASDGRPVLVDLNDWPSFSPCRQEAAEAIAGMIKQQTDHLWTDK